MIQYKNVAQNTSVQSVETVLQKFLEQSRAKLNEAIAKVDELEGSVEKKDEDADVEDLEATETPESILLSAVSEEKSRDRTYRTLVTPWLRFLWEAYRTALDILRNNARLEILYQVSRRSHFIIYSQILMKMTAFDHRPFPKTLSNSASLTNAKPNSVVSPKPSDLT